MSADEQRRLALLEADVAGLKRTQDEIRDDVKRILALVNRWRGMGAMLLLVGGAAGVVAAALAKLRSWV